MRQIKEKRYKMSMIKRSLILLAAVVCLLSAGCAKNKSSSGSESAADTSSSQVQDSSSGEDSSSDPQAEQTQQGDKIKAAAKFFENEKYEYVCKVTGPYASAKISLAKNFGECMQVTDYGFCKSVIYCKGADTIRYDDLTKAFVNEVGNITTDPTGNNITETVKKNLPPTKTHIDEKDAQKYDAEEYTYTAGTYITVLDYYFDKQSGALAKYTVTYSVEGKDDEKETREIVKMSSSEVSAIDFSENQLRENYTDFNALSEAEREKFCKELLEKNGVKEEDLFQEGLTMFDLKKISYSDFSGFLIGFAARKNEKK